MNTAPEHLTEAPLTRHQSPAADDQLELGFAWASPSRAVSRPQRRQSLASWWFQRMRQIVDRAGNWGADLPARPEQIWFPNTYRTILLGPQAGSEQRELCE